MMYDGSGITGGDWFAGANTLGAENTAAVTCDGGTVGFMGGGTTATICAGDGVADPLTVTNSSASAASYGHIITDDSGTVLVIRPAGGGNVIDLDGAPAGTCRVYGISYTGTLDTNATGGAVSDVTSDGCFDASDNGVEITRVHVDGGAVMMPSGATERLVCIDGVSDVVMFTNDSTSAATYRYVITDPAGNILGLPPVGVALQDFDPPGPGTCLVYGVSYTGNLITNVNIAGFDSDGCFSLSTNWITVIRVEVDGGRVGIVGHGASATICAGDGVADPLTVTNSSASAASYGHIITDDSGTVLVIRPAGGGNVVDLDGAPAGTCRVYGISYTGTLDTNATGGAVSDVTSDGCFDASDNGVEITRVHVDGGAVMMPSGATERLVCIDGVSDVVMFTNDSTSAATYRYVITDPAGNILGLPPVGVALQDFDPPGPGTCLVYGVSYTGNLITNVNIAGFDSDGCFSLSTNWITVIRVEVDGGRVGIVGHGASATICAGDGVADPLTVTNSSASAASYGHIITDDSGTVLVIRPAGGGNVVDLDGAPAGTCRVYGISYTGTLDTNATGGAVSNVTSDGCFDASDNGVEITRVHVDGGAVMMPSGATERLVCIDGVSDVVMFTNDSTSAATYRYVITDPAGNILGLPPVGVALQDFDPPGPGTCLVYGVSYTGNLITNVNIAGFDSDGCFSLSTNWITVIRVEVDGGRVGIAGHGASATICAGDGVADPLTVTNSSASAASYGHIITDDSGTVLVIRPAGGGNVVDLDGAPAGTCRVYGISYTGTLDTNATGGAVSNVTSDGCFDASDNGVEITRVHVDGGAVMMPSGATERLVCIDGVSDVVMFTNDSTSAATYRYVITDPAGNILGLPPVGVALQDFDPPGPGTCLVYGVSYTGNLITNVNIAGFDSDGCFSLSTNWITVIRVEVDGGRVGIVGHGASATICAGDGVADPLTVTNSSASAASYGHIITDDSGTVLVIRPAGGGNVVDLDGAPAGTCRVYGISYTGTLDTNATGGAVSDVTSDGCFDASDNGVEITRVHVDGGAVMMPSGATERLVCIDGVSDVVMFTNDSTSAATYRYVITDPAGNILGLPPVGVALQDFDPPGPGTCLVYGVSYTGNLITNVNIAGFDSDGCFSLSTNWITVIRVEVDGGRVGIAGHGASATICAGDGVADPLTVTNSSASAASYGHIITDDSGTVLVIRPAGGGNVIDLDGAPAGTCRVYGISYTGTLDTNATGGAVSDVTSDGCFDASDNGVEITRTMAEGGQVSTDKEETSVLVCMNNNPQPVLVVTANASAEASYTYIITDETGSILMISENNQIDLSGAPIGVCRIYGFSYVGSLVPQTGIPVSNLTSSSCYDLSDNYIRVERRMCSTGSGSGSTIRGLVWIDPDNNGTPADDNLDVLGLADIVVLLKNMAGQVIATTNTMDGGIFEFTGITPGTYVVEVSTQGLSDDTSTPTAYQLTIAEGEISAQLLFGFVEEPTAVTLLSFTAERNPGGIVLVGWVTGSETDQLGFYLYQSVEPDAPEIQSSRKLIRAHNRASGGIYAAQLHDANANWIWLESIGTDLSREFLGPFRITSKPDFSGKKLRKSKKATPAQVTAQVIVAENNAANFIAEGGPALVIGLTALATATDLTRGKPVEVQLIELESDAGLYLTPPAGHEIQIGEASR